MDLKTIRVLLVEDDPDDVFLVRKALREIAGAPFQIEALGRLEPALQRVSQANLDVILLDLTLPDVRGLDGLRRLNQAAPDLPVVVLTGLDDLQWALQALQGGAQDYLVKSKINSDLLDRSLRYAMERQQTQKRLKESEERYERTEAGSNDGLWDWNLKDQVIYFSPRFEAMLGYGEGEMGSRPQDWRERIHPEDRRKFDEDLARHTQKKTPQFLNEHRILQKDGSYSWVMARGRLFEGPEGEPLRIAGSLTDIAKHRDLVDQLSREAFYDRLTQLPNRAFFLQNLQRALAQSRRDPSQHFAVLFLDLDRLKYVNDSLGHSAGDQLIVEFGRRLKLCVRLEDLAARLGGDEFVLLIENIGDLQEAVQTAQRVLADMARPFRLAGQEIFATASIGLALSAPELNSAEAIISAADTAMYQAKAAGRGRYEIYDPAMRADATLQLKTASDLRYALRNQQFVLFYQPIYTLAQGVVSLEVLPGWHHPRKGFLWAKDFIPQAEETGVMAALEEWILRTLCAQCLSWQTAGFLDLSLSLDLSVKQFESMPVVSLMDRILRESNLSPRMLTLEIPGEAILPKVEEATRRLRDFQAFGFKIALDHFAATPFVSFSLLKKIPMDFLKLDPHFVKALAKDPMDSSLASLLIDVAHSLSTLVIAEGAESEKEIQALKGLKCDRYQGLYFSPPLSPDDTTKLLARAWIPKSA
jgi:diguanylate cyclase (GGDEF)-like protein/PAS domain S-box-containing protein